MKFNKLALFLLAAPILWSCSKKTENTTTTEFDITRITTNVSDNLIIPQFEDFNLSVNSLEVLFNSFIASPDASSLAAFQSGFSETYSYWQSCSFVNYGNTTLATWQGSINTYPTDTANIHSIFGNPDADLESASYTDAIGLPGLDYVLFHGTESEIIDRLTGEAKSYCEKNISLIKLKSSAAYNFWKDNTDGYYNSFKTNNSSSAGSPFSAFINGFVQNVEVFKNGQLGFPAGKFTLNVPKPDQSEALFSGISLDLYKVHLDNLFTIYKGESLEGTDGIGLDDYLKELGTTRDGENLNELILNTFTTLQDKANMLTGTMNDAIADQTEITDELYVKSKELVAYLKVDMTYAIGVDITYIDSDGD